MTGFAPYASIPKVTLKNSKSLIAGRNAGYFYGFFRQKDIALFIPIIYTLVNDICIL